MSERGGEVKTALSGTERRGVGGEAGDPPPSCERLEAVCASTSGWAGRAERTNVRICRDRTGEDLRNNKWPLQHLPPFVCVCVLNYRNVYAHMLFENHWLTAGADI